ncbi:MAG: tetratricopeptide repeat protein [Gammaproteobacteria bacterium]|nr:tetratricopeptide repeat protein [Gammaproteobacteria bacterium]
MKDEFDLLLALDDSEIDLAEAALIIARDEYPELSVTNYLEKIDQFAIDVAARLEQDSDAETIISTLNDYLFDEQGFSGNMDNYYDPRNSLLNDVIDRRSGIPISLSIIYLETGRRLGLDLEGVCFPGHFLVRFNVGQGSIILDPFFGGVSLSEDELEFRLSRLADHDPYETLEELLAPASNKSILERVLRNLRGIYMQNATHEKALNASNKILSLMPENAREYRLRGSIYQAMDCYSLALADFRRYLKLEPETEESERVRGDIIRLQSALQHLH